MLRSSRALLAALTLAAVSSSCGGGDSGPNPPPPPPPPTPANLTKQAGDNQNGFVGQAVAAAPAVKVTSSTGAAISGVTVTFAVASGGGSVTGATPATGADGVATVGSWVLGSVGTNTLTATITASGVTGNPATFTATGALTSFNPTSNTTLSGTQNYASVNIPAGVTVTATGDVTINATGAITVAGSIVGNCVAVTVSADGALNVTGTVNNACTGALPGTVPAVTLVGKGGYTFDGAATVRSSGNVTVTDDPTATDADFAPPLISLPPSLRVDGPFASVGVPCNYAAFSGTADPDHAANGTDGSPNGTDGKDGSTWTLRCKSGGDINVGLLSLVGENGGNGGNGTHTSSTAAVSHGGKGGAGGVVKIQTRGALNIGSASITTGSGGNGGSATADGSGGHGGTVGASADATGGDGGAPGLFTAKAGAGISIGGTLTIGHGGIGGNATATGGDGHDAPACPPALGGPATATAGKGGSTPDKLLVASGNVTGGLTVAGGTPGNGGDAQATSGKGGAGAQACKDGADGGEPRARGGDGGNGDLRNMAGTKVANGGNGGSMTDAGAKGGQGWNDCILPTFEPGGKGGKGGSSKGANGAGGSGFQTGSFGAATFNQVSDGGNGGNGAGPGDGGGAGSNGAILSNVVPTIIEQSFHEGLPGNACPVQPSISFTQVDPPNQNVIQGGSGSVNVTIARAGGFTGTVTVEVKDQGGTVRGTATIPSGSTNTSVPFSVPAGEPTGNRTWTVNISGTGVSSVSQEIGLNVSPSGGGNTATFQNCDPAEPWIWAAASTDGGVTWSQRTITNQTFSATFPGAKAAVATVTDRGGGTFHTDIWYESRAEMVSEGAQRCARTTVGTNTVQGLAKGIGVGQHAYTTLGNSLAIVPGTTGADVPFSWLNVATGTVDVFGTVNTAADVPQSMYLWRGVAVPLASSPLILDYGAGFPPDAGTVQINNLLGQSAFLQTAFRTSSGMQAFISTSSGTTNPRPFYLVGLSHQMPNDLNFLSVGASSGSDSRSVFKYFHGFDPNQTIDLPNPITFLSSCISPGGAPIRIRVTGSVPPGLDQLFLLSTTQSNRTVSLFESAAFQGGGPTYDLSQPDLGPAGYLPMWGMQPGPQTNTKSATGSNLVGGAFAQPSDGLIIMSASKSENIGGCP